MSLLVFLAWWLGGAIVTAVLLAWWFRKPSVQKDVAELQRAWADLRSEALKPFERPVRWLVRRFAEGKSPIGGMRLQRQWPRAEPPPPPPARVGMDIVGTLQVPKSKEKSDADR